LNVDDRDVAITGMYQGRRRMTLTYPALNRARGIFWLTTDESKADAFLGLVNGDQNIPAGRVRSDRARVIADRAAASKLNSASK
jgi:6-phosphogluconolactonase